MVILDKRGPTAILEQKQELALPLFLAETDDTTHEV
jgi:hypothetical protein